MVKKINKKASAKPRSVLIGKAYKQFLEIETRIEKCYDIFEKLNASIKSKKVTVLAQTRVHDQFELAKRLLKSNTDKEWNTLAVRAKVVLVGASLSQRKNVDDYRPIWHTLGMQETLSDLRQHVIEVLDNRGVRNFDVERAEFWKSFDEEFHPNNSMQCVFDSLGVSLGKFTKSLIRSRVDLASSPELHTIVLYFGPPGKPE